MSDDIVKVDRLDAIAQELGLPLQAVHELVKGSAISVDVLRKARIGYVYDAKEAAKRFGKSPEQWNQGRLPRGRSYRIPFQRDPVLERAKPLRPFEKKDVKTGKVTLQKYVQATDTGTHIYFGPSLLDAELDVLNDTSRPICITEGEKKALALESHGFAAIAVPGVTQWHVKGERKLHPYLKDVKWPGRIVYLCFDADALGNAQVRRNELALGYALQAAGATVHIVRYPKDTPKADDYLATHEVTEFAQLLEEARENGKLPPDTRGPTEEEWNSVWPMLRMDTSRDQPVKDLDNIVTILSHHTDWQGVLAYDVRNERQVFLREPPYREEVRGKAKAIPRAVEDTDAVRICDWFARQKCLRWDFAPKPATLEQALSIVCEQRRYDGVAAYLQKQKWDGVPRLDTAAIVYFGADDTTYNRVVFAKWMLSAVARARTPGCQADHVIVLEGPQGKGKSTALKILAGGEEYFGANLPELTSKDAHEYCVGLWLIELAELDHMKKAEVTALKAFVTLTSARYRGAYGRRASDHPRRCVFAGTTNDDSYLADATGNRRWWPIRCHTIDHAGLARDRDQLWAEALHRVRAGEPWHVTDDQTVGLIEEEQRNRRVVDPWESDLLDYAFTRARVQVPELLTKMGVPTERHDQRSANRVAAILKTAGFTRRQFWNGGSRFWAYERPTDPLTTTSRYW